MANPNPNTNPHHQDETVFVGVLQEFIDPPGGAPLDDPEVLARERRGRPPFPQPPPIPDDQEPRKE